MTNKYRLVNVMDMFTFCGGEENNPTEFERAIGNVMLAFDIANSFNSTLDGLQTVTPENFINAHNRLLRRHLPDHVSEWQCDIDMLPASTRNNRETKAVSIFRHYLDGKPTGVVLYVFGWDVHLIYIPFSDIEIGIREAYKEG